MKKGFAIFEISASLLFYSCKPASKTVEGASLKETQAWMHSFAADRGDGATFEGSGCSAAITWLDNGSPYLTFSFSFKDLDPNTARAIQTVVSPPALQNLWRATAVTTNNLKKVDVYNHNSDVRSRDSVMAGITFHGKEDADRFAKALHNAILLCGGKPSAF